MFKAILIYLTSLAPLPGAIIVIIIPSLLVGAVSIVVRRIYGYQRLAQNNTLAGIKFGIIGLTYVMLLTFATVSVWEKFSLAQEAVIDEAAAARAIYTIAKGNLKEQVAVREAVKSYLETVIKFGWPQMAQEKDSVETKDSLDRLYSTAVRYDEYGPQTTQIASELFKHIDRINDSRQTRITLCRGIVPELLWYVLLFGACLTIGFILFFGGESLVIQAVMTVITSIMMLMALLVVISFDHPFTGAVSISSEPLGSALLDMQ